MLIDKNRYKESLSFLWNKVFGDEYSFIELIFNEKYKNSILCFAELDCDRAVSAFYLIKNELMFNGVAYSGYYLYAAATLPEYRGRGIMFELIRQAQDFCRENSTDFISLVPSEKGLYGYYSGLGFESAMYRYINSEADFSAPVHEAVQTESQQRILEIRRSYKGNIINFTYDSFGYAYDCLRYSGFNFSLASSDTLIIDSPDEDSYSELISCGKGVTGLIKTKGILTSPAELKHCRKNEAVPYGMIYAINPTLERQWKYTDIYMNIALD